MKIKEITKRSIEYLLNLLILNRVFMVYLKFRNKFVYPRIEKIEGKIISNSIKRKGKDLRIHGNIFVRGVNNLVIGDYVRIGKGAFFSCEGGLTIGDNVQFSRNVLIYTNTHDIHSSAIPYDKNYIFRPVEIGNSVWIGMNVKIAPGTSIGDGAVIGMGAVISGKIPKGAIVVGAKHRIVGYRDMEDFNQKDIEKKYFGLLYPDS